MIVSKNAKYIITSLSFAQFRNLRYHQNQDIISYTFAKNFVCDNQINVPYFHE